MRVTLKARMTVILVAVAIVAGTAGCGVHIVIGGTSQVTASDVTHCDGAICSLDMSKAQTQELNTNLNLLSSGVEGAAALCSLLSVMGGPAGIIVRIVCAAGVTFVGSFFLNAISRAAGDNGCLRIQFLPTVFHDDHSNYCH